MSQDLFPDLFCIHLSDFFVSLMGELDHDGKPPPAHRKDSQLGLVLDSEVANSCVKMISHASEPVLHSLSSMNPGTVILQFAHATREENNLVIQYIQVLCGLYSLDT